jgi:hypothetical protein
MSDRCKLDLGNERFVRVCEWKGEIRIDIREYQNGVPTKKGISLPLGYWKILTNDTIVIDEALERRTNHIRIALSHNVTIKRFVNGLLTRFELYTY